ncbi:MAG: bile acid:sodium symporter family protein [Prolixibacteraceae bacterium]
MKGLTDVQDRHQLFLLPAGLFFLFSAAAFVFDSQGLASPLLIAGLICICFAMQGYPRLKGYTYTMWIFTAVSVALSYPRYFQNYEGYRFSELIAPLLQLIMFGMGSHMNLKDFSGVLKMPKGVMAGLLCHYMLMPFIGYSIAKVFGFPPEIAVGIILVACTPSGMASNVMVFLGKGNLALAITVTAFSTMISPLLTPLLLKTFAGHMVHVNVIGMVMEIVKMVLLPIVAGLSFNNFCFGGIKRKSLYWQMGAFLLLIACKNLIAYIALAEVFDRVLVSFLRDSAVFFVLPSFAGLLYKRVTKGGYNLLSRILSLMSQVGLIIITVIIVANGYDTLLSKWGLLLVPAMFLHNCCGYFAGYWFCRFIGMKEQDCRALTFEVGMQNGGMASAMAVKLQGMEQTVQHSLNPSARPDFLSSIGSGFAIPAAVFSPIQNVTGSVLAMWFRNKAIQEK